MRIEIRNLGAVKEATIEIKPLTIFVGPNSTGKTWTAYTLSAILGPYGWERYARAYAGGETSQTYPDLDQAIEQFLEKGNAKLNMIDFARLYSKTYLEDVAILARKWLGDYLDTAQASFDELEISINLDKTLETLVKHIEVYEQEMKISARPGRNQALITSLKEKDDGALYFFTTSEGHILDELPRRAVKEFLASSTFEVLGRALYPHLYIFPTERTTFITLSKVFYDHSSNNKSRLTIEGLSERRLSLAQPVIRVLELITNAFLVKSERNEEAAKKPAIAQYIELSKLLESQIFNGQVTFSTPQPSPQRELLFQPKENVALEMQVSSSMVKELTPLLLCLRYFAEPHEWLIIDEPEMNLHPASQARLIEFIAMLVNAGLQVLLTTHSPYLVDHLMNLMKAAKHTEPDVIKDKFFLQDTKAFISAEKVSVYLFEHGTASSVLDEDGYINWETFANVTEKTEHIFFDI